MDKAPPSYAEMAPPAYNAQPQQQQQPMAAQPLYQQQQPMAAQPMYQQQPMAAQPQYQQQPQTAYMQQPGVVIAQPVKTVYQESPVWLIGPFGCLDDIGLCLLGCFCPCYLWAKTMEQNNLLSFALALVLFLTAYILGVLLPWVLNVQANWPNLWLMILGTYFRGKFREAQGITNGGCFEDCLLWCCCTPCAICQEAKHTDRALVRKHNFEQAQNQVQVGVVVNTAP